MEGNVLAIVGLALALVFGIFSIWAYRKSKKKTSLRFRKVQCYSLFKDDVARLNIEVS
jgi:hypothetical protein